MFDHFHPPSRTLLVWTLWILSPAWFAAALAAPPAESIPLWQQGISRWDGQKYVDPVAGPTRSPAAAVGGSTARPASTTPYTVPQTPGSQTPASQTPGSQTPASQTPGSQAAVAGGTSGATGGVSFAAPSNAATAADNVPLPMIDPLPPPLTDPLPSGDDDDTTLTEQLDQGDAAVEEAPLESAVTRWYEYPVRWMKGWNSHAEFGLNGSDGNADTLALQTGLEMKRKTKIQTFALDFDYRQATNRGVTTEDNGRMNVDYDRMFKESPWSTFAKYGMEWDQFKSFDLRLNMDAGLGYHWVRSDTASLVTRFGAGAAKEIGAPDDGWVPEAVFGIEAERQLTARQKLKGKIDYFPAWEDFNDYRLVADVAWEILLDGSENLSLKLAATDRYDSTPQGAKPNDVYYSLLLLYKF